MFGIASIIAFGIAVIMNAADLSKGHLNYVLFALIGLLCLAVHVTTIGGWWGPARRG